MLKKPALLLVALLLSFVSAFAQHAVVRGVVRDEKGKPIAGVGVADAQTGIGPITDAKGFYRIEIESDKIVRVNYYLMGFELQTLRFNLQSSETKTKDVVLPVDIK